MLVASALYILVLPMLKILAQGMFGRVLGYAGIVLGFWLLYQGFSRPSPGLGVLGGIVILAAMSLMVAVRRQESASLMARPKNEEEDDFIDPLDGSNQGSKLPP